MWMKVTDVAQNRITLNTDQVLGLIIPSPLGGGDGKCRIFLNGMILEVSQAEAQRVSTAVMEAASITRALVEAGAKES
jgi:hypothetical protein